MFVKAVDRVAAEHLLAARTASGAGYGSCYSQIPCLAISGCLGDSVLEAARPAELQIHNFRAKHDRMEVSLFRRLESPRASWCMWAHGEGFNMQTLLL